MRSNIRAGWIALLAALLAGPAASADPAPQPASAPASTFSPSQRAEIVEIVRAALRTDPSILRDAVAALRADEQQRETAAQTQSVGAHATELATGDAVAGNPHGDVTLVEFYDPRCGYCKRMLPTIAAEIAHDPKLRVIYRVIPILGPASVLEAEAIVAAGLQGGYVAMKDALMAEAAPADPDRIAAIAASLKLDGKGLLREMSGSEVAATIKGDLELARALHIDGTPALVLGGQLITGAMSADELSRAVKEARS